MPEYFFMTSVLSTFIWPLFSFLNSLYSTLTTVFTCLYHANLQSHLTYMQVQMQAWLDLPRKSTLTEKAQLWLIFRCKIFFRQDSGTHVRGKHQMLCFSHGLWSYRCVSRTTNVIKSFKWVSAALISNW